MTTSADNGGLANAGYAGGDINQTQIQSHVTNFNGNAPFIRMRGEYPNLTAHQVVHEIMVAMTLAFEASAQLIYYGKELDEEETKHQSAKCQLAHDTAWEFRRLIRIYRPLLTPDLLTPITDASNDALTMSTFGRGMIFHRDSGYGCGTSPSFASLATKSYMEAYERCHLDTGVRVIAVETAVAKWLATST